MFLVTSLAILGCWSKSSMELSSPVAEIRWDDGASSQLSISEFQRQLALELGVYDSISLRHSSIISAAKKRVLQNWILAQLISHQLQGIKALPQAEDIEKEKKLWQSKLPDDNSWQLALVEAKLSASRLDEVIYEKLLYERFFSWLRSGESFDFDESEVESVYKSSPEDSKVPESLKLAQILVKQRDQAEDLKRLIESGAISFEQAAQRFSLSPEGQLKAGVLGWVDKGDFRAFDGLFKKNAKVNSKAISLIESEWGIHLIKILDAKPARKIDLKASRPQILQQLRQQKEQGLYLKWLTKTLDSVKISINYPWIQAIEVKLREEGT
ncbi:MAG: peptidylprolyl isomerase [Bdellovibrionaceae bacterium]|nr:peptidylprolyl isomerase [Pseudobdellovibrionaceae bacterium]